MKKAIKTFLKNLKKNRYSIIVTLILACVLLVLFDKKVNEKAELIANKKINDAVTEGVKDYIDKNPVILEPVTNELTAEIILKTIKGDASACAELATLSVPYRDVGILEESKTTGNFKWPFSEKRVIVQWDGVIKYGVDLKLIECDVDLDGGIVNIKLPRARQLSSEIVKDSYKVLDENGGLFNPTTAEDVLKLVDNSVAETEARLSELGYIQQAEKNSENVLKSLFLSHDGFNSFEYIFTFE